MVASISFLSMCISNKYTFNKTGDNLYKLGDKS